MKLLDLTSAYCRYIVEGDSWRDYERCFPALFQHYFHFWAKRNYPNVRLSTEVLSEHAELIKRRLPLVLGKFESKGFDVGDPSFVLFVGKGCTNGHAMQDTHEWIVWLPVESYSTISLVDIFVTHEIAHALHYSRSPRFYFRTKGEQRNFSRQLLTEGIATYVTAEALGCSENTALWGGFLRPQHLRHWRSECKAAWSELTATALRKFDSESQTELFQANDPSDVFKYRGGYLLGLKLIKAIVSEKKLTTSELLSRSRAQLEHYARKQLIKGL